MSIFDLMLLPFELIIVGAAAWCATMLVTTVIGEIFEVVTKVHSQD